MACTRVFCMQGLLTDTIAMTRNAYFFFLVVYWADVMNKAEYKQWQALNMGVTTRSAWVRLHGSAIGWAAFCRRNRYKGCTKTPVPKTSTTSTKLTLSDKKKKYQKTFTHGDYRYTKKAGRWSREMLQTPVPKRTSTTSTKLTLSDKKKKYQKTFKHGDYRYTKKAGRWSREMLQTPVPKRTSTTSTKLTLSDKKKKYQKTFKHGDYRYTKKAGRWSREMSAI